jgi:hypothetical protein
MAIETMRKSATVKKSKEGERDTTNKGYLYGPRLAIELLKRVLPGFSNEDCLVSAIATTVRESGNQEAIDFLNDNEADLLATYPAGSGDDVRAKNLELLHKINQLPAGCADETPEE